MVKNQQNGCVHEVINYLPSPIGTICMCNMQWKSIDNMWPLWAEKRPYVKLTFQNGLYFQNQFFKTGISYKYYQYVVYHNKVC